MCPSSSANIVTKLKVEQLQNQNQVLSVGGNFLNTTMSRGALQPIQSLIYHMLGALLFALQQPECNGNCHLYVMPHIKKDWNYSSISR